MIDPSIVTRTCYIAESSAVIVDMLRQHIGVEIPLVTAAAQHLAEAPNLPCASFHETDLANKGHYKLPGAIYSALEVLLPMRPGQRWRERELAAAERLAISKRRQARVALLALVEQNLVVDNISLNALQTLLPVYAGRKWGGNEVVAAQRLATSKLDSARIAFLTLMFDHPMALTAVPATEWLQCVNAVGKEHAVLSMLAQTTFLLHEPLDLETALEVILDIRSNDALHTLEIALQIRPEAVEAIGNLRRASITAKVDTILLQRELNRLTTASPLLTHAYWQGIPSPATDVWRRHDSAVAIPPDTNGARNLTLELL